MQKSFDYYVGLDVSQKTTSICVIDPAGKKYCEGKSFTRPGDINGWLLNRIEEGKILKIGLEAGTMSSWLYSGLVKLGHDVVCMETLQAHRFLKTYRNKTDKNDARGLAQLLRMGGEDFLKVVTIRSQAAQETRVLLAMRDHLVTQKISLENHISGVLKPFGVIVERGNVTADTFYKRTLEALSEAERNGVNVRAYVLPSLFLYKEAAGQIAPLTTKIETIANSIEMVRRFMEIPGVGPITALSFYAAVDSPHRFTKSTDVAAYFGLTPKQFQSGETDYMGKISKRGDPGTRRMLVIAATVLLTASQQWNSLKAWGVRLAKRIGLFKARIAVARKLAMIMHKIWLNNDRFRPKAISSKDRAQLKQELDSGNSKSRPGAPVPV
ncbi:IS110 family transposase [Pseudochrobactrum lubricantis]|uniref:IS110 family transposase n=1 Tax=Pseudochrobactrum lubricantis TaxID=558172 RepID=UPI0035DC8138